MYQILEDYKTIYQAEAFGKLQRKKQHQAMIEWLNKEYTDIPDLHESMTFSKENRDIKFVKQFYDRLIFPRIRSGDKYDADALLMVFQNDMVYEYLEYLSWEVSFSELENFVLEKYPYNKTILEDRYKRHKYWFDHSIHGLPSGILYDYDDSASIEDLDEMKSDIAEFQETCSKLNIDNDEYIRHISDLYNAYEQYLINIEKYSDFQEYLEENHIEY